LVSGVFAATALPTIILNQFYQNGWPSVTYEGVEPNSPNAVANVQNEKVVFLFGK
jgi:hypothetical protein